MLRNMVTYNNIVTFPVQSYVLDVIDDLDCTEEEFAKMLNISLEKLNEFLYDGRDLTVEMAIRLDVVTGVNKLTWLSLQSTYKSKMLRIGELKEKESL